MYCYFKKQNRDTLRIEGAPIYLLFIILIGLILRIYNLGKFGFWFDEATLLLLAGQLKEIFSFSSNVFGTIEIFPVVILLKCWRNISSNDFFLRFFSVIWGILSIIMIYRLGEFIFSRKVGILSALFLSISPIHIYYSQELSSYSLSVFLALVSSYCFLKILKNPNYILSILYVLTTSAFIYTHPINFIFILTQNVFFYLFYYKDKYLRRKWKYLQLIIFLFSLPCLGIVIVQFLRFSQVNIFFWIPKPSLRALLQTFMVFSLGYHASWKLQLLALAIFLFLSLKAIFYWHKKNEIFYLVFWIVFPISLIWLISQFHPFYLHRIFLFVLPAFCLLAAAGLVKNKRYLEVGIIGLYLILLACSLKNYYENKFPPGYQMELNKAVWPKKDYKEAAIYIAENFQKGDIILHICRSSFIPFIYYHQKKFPEFGIKLKDIYKKDWIISNEGIYKRYRNTFKYLEIKERYDLGSYKRVWLIDSSWEFWGRIYLPKDGINKEIVDWFDKNFSRENIRMFKGINIYLFSSVIVKNRVNE